MDQRLELNIAAMHRSGHHAVINWIISQLSGSVVFLNDLNHVQNLEAARFYYDRNAPDNDTTQPKDDSHANHLIVSLEDIMLDRLERELTRWRMSYFNARRNCYKMLILRDAFNTFASRYKRSLGPSRYDEDHWIGARAIALWKDQALEFIHYSRCPADDIILVSYNDWFTSRSYRASISENLGIPFCDRALADVPRFGGGSSFDGLAFDEQAQSMDVLSRWKFFREDPDYWAIFDRELMQLSDEIFGCTGLPGNVSNN